MVMVMLVHNHNLIDDLGVLEAPSRHFEPGIT